VTDRRRTLLTASPIAFALFVLLGLAFVHPRSEDTRKGRHPVRVTPLL